MKLEQKPAWKNCDAESRNYQAAIGAWLIGRSVSSLRKNGFKGYSYRRGTHVH